MVRQKQDGALPDLGTRWPGPVHKAGPAEPGMLRARHHSAAAGGHVPLPTQDLSPALPCHTHPRVLWLCTHGAPMCWSFLNAVQENRRWVASVPTSSSPPTPSVHKFLTAHQPSAKLYSALIVRHASWGQTHPGPEHGLA